MRTYEVLDANGNVVNTQEMEDSMAPTLFSGQTARLVEVDGSKLAKSSRQVIDPAFQGDDLPHTPETLVTVDEEKAAKATKAAAKAAKADAKDEAKSD